MIGTEPALCRLAAPRAVAPRRQRPAAEAGSGHIDDVLEREQDERQGLLALLSGLDDNESDSRE